MKSNTGSLDQSQETNTLSLTGSAPQDAQEMATDGRKREGEKLAKLIDDNRYEKKEFGVAAGVTKQAVDQWCNRDDLSPSIWEKVLKACATLGLDPGFIRPEATTKAPPEDLTRLVENWTRVQLIVLKRILESDDTSRRVLLGYVTGSLRQIPE